MTTRSTWLRRMARPVLVRLDRMAAWVRRRSHDEPLEHLRLVPYRGHGRAEAAVVRGRALDDPPPHPVVVGESPWRSARRMLRWFESDEVPGVPLAVELGADHRATTTDEEGYFGATLAPAWTEPGGGWRQGRVRLVGPFRGVDHREATVEVLVPDPAAAWGVVSDIDDTVLQTGAQRLFEMVRTTLFGSSRSRQAFPGVAELYRALAAGPATTGDHPVFYVSKSPWNLYEFLVEFLDYRELPKGPLLLRDLGVTNPRAVSPGEVPHKRAMIDEILALHADLAFVLIGDSGEGDPQLYANMVARHPGRVRAVFIRDVATGERSATTQRLAARVTAGGTPMAVAPDSVGLARHAADLGLIPAAAVGRVERVSAADSPRPAPPPVPRRR